MKTVKIDGITYQSNVYWMAKKIKPRIDFVRRFFETQNNLWWTPLNYRRRKTVHEFGEASLMLLARVYSILESKSVVHLGSAFLKETPWVTLGDYDCENINFVHFMDVIEYYSNLLTGSDSHQDLYFRNNPEITEFLSKKTNRTYSTIASVAICFMCDVIWNCGPDCSELFDIFSNDFRDEEDLFDLNVWEQQRMLLIGRYGAICKKPFNLNLSKNKTFNNEVRFEEIETNNNVLCGDKLISLVKKPFYTPNIEDDYSDDYGEAPIDYSEEGFYAYYSRMNKKHNNIPEGI